MTASVLRRLALILAGVLFAALLSELLLRTVYTVPEVANPLYSFHESDPVLGWRGKRDVSMRFRRPDFDALIAQGPDGWRLPQPPPPAQPARRILVLGDSFTWGWGVSQGEVFTDRLQAMLPADGIYNRGVNGFGTGQQLLLLERELAAQHYDVVVLLFFQNDVLDNINPKRGRRPLFTLADGRLVPPQEPPVPLMNPVQRFFKDHSRLFQLLDFRISMIVRGLDDDDPRPRQDDPVDVHYDQLPGADVTQRLLEEMQRVVAAHGARFVLVYLPHHTEIVAARSGMPYVRAVHELIRDVGRRDGVTLVDLTEAFRTEAAAGAVLTFPSDEHWTVAGHELAATVIAPAL